MQLFIWVKVSSKCVHVPRVLKIIKKVSKEKSYPHPDEIFIWWNQTILSNAPRS